MFVGRVSEAVAPRRGECGSCPDFTSNTLEFTLQLGKNHGKNLSQSSLLDVAS